MALTRTKLQKEFAPTRPRPRQDRRLRHTRPARGNAAREPNCANGQRQDRFE